MGVSPEYFLDEMSFDEMEALIKVDDEKYRDDLERDRLNWFFTNTAPGLSKAREPKDLYTFSWERPEKKEAKKLNSRELREKANRAKQWQKKA